MLALVSKLYGMLPASTTGDPAARTPADNQWRQGDDVIIAGSVSDEEAKELFGEWRAPLGVRWSSGKPGSA